jgi:hypothetical protein
MRATCIANYATAHSVVQNCLVSLRICSIYGKCPEIQDEVPTAQ